MNNLQKHMLILKAMLFNHGASYTTREIVFKFLQLELNATYLSR